MEQRRYTKLGIFIFMFFIMLLIIFSASVISMISRMFDGINNKNNEIKCSDVNIVIEKDSILYRSGNLAFEILSRNYNMNITNVDVMPDSQEKDFRFAFDPPIRGGGAKYITINNISIERGFNVTVNNCTANTKFFDLP